MVIQFSKKTLDGYSHTLKDLCVRELCASLHYTPIYRIMYKNRGGVGGSGDIKLQEIEIVNVHQKTFHLIHHINYRVGWLGLRCRHKSWLV